MRTHALGQRRVGGHLVLGQRIRLGLVEQAAHRAFLRRAASWNKSTAAAAVTFRDSTPFASGIVTGSSPGGAVSPPVSPLSHSATGPVQSSPAGSRPPRVAAGADFESGAWASLVAGSKGSSHSDGGARQADLRLDLRETALAPRDGLPAIAPGNPSGSALVQRIYHTDPAEQMPPIDSERTAAS